ncbi:LysE/ArgO family amino acid transporter [Brevirhabdus sp.]|uniref:LysE/ArgO family amino acid transporter n=1 Tax=Brevirhabdus sp. TaxID=2004514 RepID=UPI0040590EAA
MTALSGAALTGFLTGFSLILAIGAQNAFVLRQGLMRRHVLPLCLVCAGSDALLIAAGVAGFATIIGLWPWLPDAMALGGALFLLVYGALRLRAAWAGSEAVDLSGETGSLSRTLAVALALTWLNPHVYLDTLGLIGAISTSYAALPAKLAFGIGATTASFVFFFALGYGARLLAPVMSRPAAWRILDLMIALVMWGIALGLLRGVMA